MKTYAIEEGEFVTNGETDEHGNIVGVLTNHRGTRRHVVAPSEMPHDEPAPKASVPLADAPTIVTKAPRRR